MLMTPFISGIFDIFDINALFHSTFGERAHTRAYLFPGSPHSVVAIRATPPQTEKSFFSSFLELHTRSTAHFTVQKNIQIPIKQWLPCANQQWITHCPPINRILSSAIWISSPLGLEPGTHCCLQLPPSSVLKFREVTSLPVILIKNFLSERRFYALSLCIVHR